MKRFAFKLEALRTLRQRAEQKALERYAQALLQRQQALQKLHGAEHELGVSLGNLRGQMAAGCSAGDIQHARVFTRELESRRDQCSAVLAEAEREMNTALRQLDQSRRAREVVDKFHDRQRMEFDREMLRDEFRELDDLASRRAPLMGGWPQAA